MSNDGARTASEQSSLVRFGLGSLQPQWHVSVSLWPPMQHPSPAIACLATTTTEPAAHEQHWLILRSLVASSYPHQKRSFHGVEIIS